MPTSIKNSLSFLNTLLLVFAGIAVFVGAFIIFNTFSITVAQRTGSSRCCARWAPRGARCCAR